MQIIQSPLLKNFINLSHGFTTKDAGKSNPPYKSLNLAFHVGDNKESVTQNHQLLAKNLHYKKETLVHMQQIHSNKVHIVSENDNFANPPKCDALITNKLGTPLMVMVADCSPILFYDTKQKVIAVAHAGRAGTFKNIVHNVLQSFVNDFYSNTDDIIVSVGPAIGVCCYKVGEEVYDEARLLNLEYAMFKKGNNLYLNIALILKNQLLHEGVKEKNIDISTECSSCHNDKYFSYRADDITGRFCGVIELQ